MSKIHDCREPGRLTLNRAFNCLSHPDRRLILTSLVERDVPPERGIDCRDIQLEAEEREGLAYDLYHDHLPYLAATGCIEWDHESTTVAKGENFEDISPLVDLLKRNEEELPGDWQ